MSNWEIKEIKSIGRVVTGKTPPKNELKYFDGEHLFVSPKDLDWDELYVLETETKITKDALVKFKNQVIPRNAIMYTSLSFSFGKIGIASEPSLTNQQISSVIVNTSHDFKFIYYLLRANRPLIFSYNSGIDTPIVPKSVFEKIELKCPPLSIQRKIAAILSAYDDLIENNDRRITLLEKMAEEIYREWFVRLRFPGHKQVKFHKGIPEGWAVVELGDVVNDIIDYRGITPGKLNSDWQDQGIIALSALNVKTGKLIRLEDAKRVSEVLFEKWMRKKLEQLDILLTSEAPLGEVYILMGETKYVLSQRLFAIRANPEVVNPFYLYYYLLCEVGQYELTSKATGSTVGGIRQALLRKVAVLIPTSIVQREFSTIAEPILRNIQRLWCENNLLKQTRDRLLTRLISGKLSVEDLDIQFPPSMTEIAEASYD